MYWDSSSFYNVKGNHIRNCTNKNKRSEIGVTVLMLIPIICSGVDRFEGRHCRPYEYQNNIPDFVEGWDDSHDQGWKCRDSEGNWKCLPRRLTCDKIEHCDDQTDEKEACRLHDGMKCNMFIFQLTKL